MSVVSANGIQVKSYDDCRNYLVDLYRAQFGPDINTDSVSPTGQLIDIQAQQDWEIWQAIQDVYNSSNPSKATGISLDFLADQKGITRSQHTEARVMMQLWTASDDPIALDSGFTVASNRKRWEFELRQNLMFDFNGTYGIYICIAPDYGNITGQVIAQIDSINLTGTKQTTQRATLQSLANSFLSNQLVENEGKMKLLTKIEASAEVGSIFADEVTDVLRVEFSNAHNIVRSGFVGVMARAYAIRALFYRNEPTSQNLAIGDVNVISTPNDAVVAVENVEMSSRGRYKETDSELRSRLVGFLVNGKATAQMIEFYVRNGVPSVTMCKVTTKTRETNADGRILHNFVDIAVAGAGDKASIMAVIDAIATSKAAGVPTFYGGQGYETRYHEGTQEWISFMVPTDMYIWMQIEYTQADGESLLDNFQGIVIEALRRQINEMDVGTVLVGNRFLSTLYSYPGFGQSIIKLSYVDPQQSGFVDWQESLRVDAGFNILLAQGTPTNPAVRFIPR